MQDKKLFVKKLMWKVNSSIPMASIIKCEKSHFLMDFLAYVGQKQGDAGSVVFLGCVRNLIKPLETMV
jgi:hypothetical protein